MLRDIDLELKRWARASRRKPLLVRGARQVGKSFSIEKLAKEEFEVFCKIDFEEEPEFAFAFEQDLVPNRIVKDIASRKNIEIKPGKTLLFFDEIQVCPKAIMALRYFYEGMPDLHVIAAGSLLEFVLAEADFSFPVGRVQMLYVRPFSFREFLRMKGEIQALKAIEEATFQEPVGQATHLLLIRLLKEYFVIGGMPGVLSQETEAASIRIGQRSILEMYANDFGKYGKESQQKYLRALFEKTPYVVGEHFKYSKIDPAIDARDLRRALELLTRSGLIHRISLSSASGIPLAAQVNEKKFKLLFLDIGLLNSRLSAPLDFLSQQDLVVVHAGALAEQFVGQELIAYATPHYAPDLFYWEREKAGADAEIDYVLEVGGTVIPVEVKAGKSGRMRSLRQFMEEKKAPWGVRLSQLPLTREGDIISIPLYMVSEISRLLRSL